METSHESLSNGYLHDPCQQIIRNSSYQSPSRFSLSWFDIRVFYVRISNFMVDDSTPESLTLNHISLSPETPLEVNGVRCTVDPGVSCALRKDRMDKKTEEATFVSTDSIRLTGSMKFEIFDKKELVISGTLEMPHATGFVGELNQSARSWSMNCDTVFSAGTVFLNGKQLVGTESTSPTIEVYVAGCFSGTPIILTKTLQLKHRKKHKMGTLNSIPECEASESHEDLTFGQDLQVAEYKRETEEDCDNLYWRRTEYIEGEDGELSWFNAGVRVGVGIGLGICLGIGIGVGLLVRSYQTTARTFRRRLA
ncbi:uncharacterized protein At1g01500-like [Primulina huaijiensis]|uniref:uncharacterized protein At1g01500-like n=1 Tax=Primulina huaijiensis TaxID=1492673 RepID=UPI003CC6E6C5